MKTYFIYLLQMLLIALIPDISKSVGAFFFFPKLVTFFYREPAKENCLSRSAPRQSIEVQSQQNQSDS